MIDHAVLGAGMIIAVLLIVLSQIDFYRVEKIAVLYMINGGLVQEINIRYRYFEGRNWTSITDIEQYIAKQCQVSNVKILSVLVYERNWKIRRCRH